MNSGLERYIQFSIPQGPSEYHIYVLNGDPTCFDISGVPWHQRIRAGPHLWILTEDW